MGEGLGIGLRCGLVRWEGVWKAGELEVGLALLLWVSCLV